MKKNYEIEGLRFASNIYYDLKVTRINRFLEKLAPVVLIGLVVWVLYIYQLLSAITYYAGERIVIFN